MSEHAHIKGSDLRGYSRLVIDATVQMTSIVENMHRNIARTPVIFGESWQGRTEGITGLVYGSIRAISSGVGMGLDLLLGQLAPHFDRLLAEAPSSYVREGLIALINGVVGDHLEASGNPLAIRMSLRHQGRPLTLDPRAIVEAIPQANHRLLVLAHGLCMNDLEFVRQGHDHGRELARELDLTPVHLHYNSGRHVSQNGREFAEQLEQLVGAWPMAVEELHILGFSMGGLVTRSACHYAQQAGHRWPALLKRIVFVGTPHHGAPLERGGNWLQWSATLTPYTAPLGRLGMLRSAGVTDLRHGNLLDEDWQGRDRFEDHQDRRTPVPLPAGVRCHAIAATTSGSRGGLNDRVIGDGLVLPDSALGHHAQAQRALNLPEARQHIVYGTSHLGLLNSREVYLRLKHWLSQP